MSKGEPIITYLSKFTQVWDELGGVGVFVVDNDLMSLALLGIHKSWYSFQDAVSGIENIPNQERLWSDCVQEEFWRGTRAGRLTKTEQEEIFALAGKGRNAKGKEGQGKAESSQKCKKKKKDLCKISNASIAMSLSTMPPSVLIRRSGPIRIMWLCQLSQMGFLLSSRNISL